MNALNALSARSETPSPKRARSKMCFLRSILLPRC
jgi:hypothetical protein